MVIKSFFFLVSIVLMSLIYSVLPFNDSSIFSIDIFVLLFVAGCFLYSKTPPNLWCAWFLGMIQDLLFGSVLGEHAIALLITVYMMLLLQQRMQFFVLWQQIMCVGCLTLINQLIIALFEAAQGNFASIYIVLTPTIMNMALWLCIGSSFIKYRKA